MCREGWSQGSPGVGGGILSFFCGHPAGCAFVQGVHLFRVKHKVLSEPLLHHEVPVQCPRPNTALMGSEGSSMAGALALARCVGSVEMFPYGFQAAEQVFPMQAGDGVGGGQEKIGTGGGRVQMEMISLVIFSGQCTRDHGKGTVMA